MHAPSTRRDSRYSLRAGSSCVEFTDPAGTGSRMRGALVIASAAGIAFQIDGEPERYAAGTSLDQALLRVGECILEGEAVVRNVRRIAPERIEVGCLFYPAVHDEDRWMTLLAGIELAGGSG
jgi:hypothetical protein